jgi:VWFA-related protein
MRGVIMKRIIALVLSVACVFSVAFSQTPTTPQKPQQETTPEDIIRISTALVQTDVVVTDKNDHVIPDLKLEEFKVFESGKRQDVKFMEFVSPDSGPRVEGSVKIAGQAAESEVSRNLTAGELRRVFAFVVDDLTIPIQDVANVRKLLTNFVDNQMRDGDLVAIVRVVGGTGLLQQFTSDKRILRRAISRITPQLSVYSAFNNLPGQAPPDTSLLAAATGETTPFPAEAISAANNNIDSSNDGTTRGFRALVTLQTASEVTNSMRVLPGRKSLVLISGGLPLFESAQDQMTIGGVPVNVSETRTYLGSTSYLLNLLIDRASRAGVVINTLDIRGLAGNGGVAHFNDPGNEASSALFGGSNSGGRLGRTPNMGEFDNLGLDTISGHMGLQALASSTGGIAVVNTNNFSEALDRVVARSSYYLLAYTPTEPFDAKFHKLEIKVSRPGARVYAREGYVAKADPPATTQTREDAIVKAAMSPLAKNEVEIAGRLQYRFLPENRAQVDINLLINANNLDFKQGADGQYQSTFDVVGFLLNSVGKTQGGFGQTVHATLSPAEYKRALTGGINYTGHAELPAGTYQLRAVVREESTGRLGSFSQYLEVPNLAKNHLTASSLFLYAVDPNPGSKVPPDPLIALRLLPRKQDLRYAAIIYNPKVTASGTQLRSQVFLSHDGKIVFQEAETPVTAAVQEGQVIKIGQLGLGKASAGRYVLTLVITDPQANKQERTIVRSIDFTLVD